MRTGVAFLAGLLIYVASGIVQAKFGSFYLSSEHVNLASSQPFALVEGSSPGEIVMRLVWCQAAINFVMLIALGCATKLIAPKWGTLATLPVLALLLMQRIIGSSLEHSSLLWILTSLVSYCVINFIAVLIGEVNSARGALLALSMPIKSRAASEWLAALADSLRQLAQIILHHRAQPFGIERFG